MATINLVTNVGALESITEQCIWRIVRRVLQCFDLILKCSDFLISLPDLFEVAFKYILAVGSVSREFSNLVLEFCLFSNKLVDLLNVLANSDVPVDLEPLASGGTLEGRFALTINTCAW